MTREEAIDCLEGLKIYLKTEHIDQEALDMAIEALQAESVQGVGRYENAIQKLREMPRYLNGVKAKQKSAKYKAQGEWIVTEHCSNEYSFRKWIEIECPFCGEKPTYENLDNMNYCPNCGAKMKGQEE